jgi:hypothetical protein
MLLSLAGALDGEPALHRRRCPAEIPKALLKNHLHPPEDLHGDRW